MTRVKITAISAAGLKNFPVKNITVTFKESLREVLSQSRNKFHTVRATITYKDDQGNVESKEVMAIVNPQFSGETTVSMMIQDGTIGGYLHTDIIYPK